MGFSKFVTTDNNVIPDAVGVRSGDLFIDEYGDRVYRFIQDAILDARYLRSGWSETKLPGGSKVFTTRVEDEAHEWTSLFADFLIQLTSLEEV